MNRPRNQAWVYAALIVLLAVMVAAAMARSNAGPPYAGHRLRYWVGELAGDDYQARLRAETALRGMGREALPELARLAGMRDGGLGAVWREGWQRIFPQRPPRPDPEAVSIAAIRLLATLGEAAAPAAPVLVRQLASGSAAVARETEGVLRRIGPAATGPLAGELAQGTPARQDRVLRLLATSGGVEFGRGATNLLIEIINTGMSPDATLRLDAVKAADALGIGTKRTFAFLVVRLDDTDESVRCASAAALGRMGSGAVPATDRLTLMARDGSPRDRVEAASALWEITGDADRVLPPLISLLSDPEVRSSAAVVLGKMGGRAAPAVPTLLATLVREQSHRPSRTPSMVAVALGKVGPDAVPGLVALVGHPDADVRVNAAFALRGQGRDAAPAVPALGRMLRASDAEERMTAATTLAAIGPAATAVEDDLEDLAGETSGDVIVGHVASAARDALRRIRGNPGHLP